MKHYLLILMVGLVCGVAPVSVQSAPAGNPDADPVPAPRGNEEAQDAAALPAINLHLVPNQVSINRSISFDDNGEQRSGNHNLSVGFRCEYATDDQPLSYSDIKLTSVVTSAGESLDINSDRHRQRANQTIQPDRRHNGKPFFNLYLNLPAPRQAAESLREIRGTIKMQLSDGPERAIRLSPISKYLGKRFKITDMDDTPMSLRLQQRNENEPPQLEFIHPRSAQPLIRDISFVDARGQKLEVRRRGTHGSNDEMRQQFDQPDDKSTMIIRLFRQTREIEVPFVVRDVPLPVPEPGEPQFDFALETEPVNMANAAQPAVDEGNRGEDVRVIILD